MIDINIDEEQFIRAKELLKTIPKAAEKAAVRAINRSVAAGKAAIPKEIKKVYSYKKGLGKTIVAIRANTGNLTGVVKAEGAPQSLSKFKLYPKSPPKRKSLVKAGVKTGGLKPIPSAFVAKMKSGHIGAFVREGKRRWPIKGLYGPSVPQMFANDDVLKPVAKRAQEVLAERFEHEVQAILGGFVN